IRSALAVLGAVLVLHFDTSAQQQPPGDQLVAVSTMFHGRALIYSSNSEEPVFFEGEVPRLSISVHNSTVAPLRLGRSDRSWVDDVTLSIQPSAARQVPIRARLHRATQPGPVLQPGRGEYLFIDVLP